MDEEETTGGAMKVEGEEEANEEGKKIREEERKKIWCQIRRRR
jgi:hypothetical protein